MIGYSQSGFTSADDEQRFWVELNATIAFCMDKYRSTDPVYSLRRLEESVSDRSILERRENVVSAIQLRRSDALLAEGYEIKPNPPEDLSGGRLLAFFPDHDLSDGTAEAETNGFFDACNTPPYDTWIAIVAAAKGRSHDDFLISWVPGEIIGAVNEAIQINPEECIQWLENHPHPLAKALEREGLL
ncbi:MAG: hypothetical protein ACFBZ9_11175 [Sphingomonadales bacterium]